MELSIAVYEHSNYLKIQDGRPLDKIGSTLIRVVLYFSGSYKMTIHSNTSFQLIEKFVKLDVGGGII